MAQYEYQHETEEACSHHHSRSKKSKKNKKQKKRSRSRSGGGGFKTHKLLPVRKHLLYKGVKWQWRLTQSGDETVEEVIKDILAEDVGVHVNVLDQEVRTAIMENELFRESIKTLLHNKEETLAILSRKIKSIEKKKEYCSIALLKPTVDYTLQQLIPESFIGPNKEVLVLAIKRSLWFGIYDKLPMMFFMNKIRPKTVIWLKQLKMSKPITHDQQQNVMAKIIKWLYNTTKKLLATVFYITEGQSTSGMLWYIPKKVWQSWSDAAFNRLIEGSVIVKVNPDERICTTVQSPQHMRKPAVLRWLPKKMCGTKCSGLRPIISVRGDKDNAEIIMAKIFLKSVLRMVHAQMTLPRLENIWYELVNQWKMNKTKLYYVSVDIEDAYTSINQEKLLVILEQTVLRVLGGQSEQAPAHISDQQVTLDYYNKAQGNVRELLTDSKQLPIKNSKTVKVADLMRTIKKVVRNQRIQKERNLYHMIKGISQAMPLSHSMCNLYLADLDERCLQSFREHKADLCFRALDDYVYITPDLERAKQFLNTMISGFGEYGIKINPKKTQHNIDGHVELTFYGFNFNTTNLEVYPHFNLDIPTRNTITFSGKTPISKLPEERMKRILQFKLNKIMFNPQNMTQQGMARNIFEVSCLMACNLVALLNTPLVVLSRYQLMTLVRRSAHQMASLVYSYRRPHTHYHIVSLAMATTTGPAISNADIRWLVVKAFKMCLSHKRFKRTIYPVIPSLNMLERKAKHKANGDFVKNTLPIIKTISEKFTKGHKWL